MSRLSVPSLESATGATALPHEGRRALGRLNLSAEAGCGAHRSAMIPRTWRGTIVAGERKFAGGVTHSTGPPRF